MALSLKHAFVSAIPDGADNTLVRPSNWNAEHTITCSDNTLLGRVGQGSSGGVLEVTVTDANFNTFFGQLAGNSTLTGTQNVAIGYQAGHALTVPAAGANPQANVLVGYQAGAAITSARETVAIGYQALTTFTGDGSGVDDGINTAVGSQCLQNLTTGPANVCIGQKSGENITTAGHNVMVGTHCGTGLSAGNYNTLIGHGVADTTLYAGGDQNVAIGAGSFGSTGAKNNNVMIGYQAGNSQGIADGNTFLGTQSGQLNQTGTRLVCLGHQAGNHSTTVNDNTCVGYTAGTQATGGTNTFIGSQAGYTVTSGQGNTIVGYSSTSGPGVTTGSYNTIVGAGITGLSSSLANNVLITDGQGNTRLQIDSASHQLTHLSNVFSISNTTHSQTLYLYNTTSGGNYERLAIIASGSQYTIAGDAGGTGTVHPVQIGNDPTSDVATCLGRIAFESNRNNVSAFTVVDVAASGHTWSVGCIQGAGYFDFRDTTASGAPVVASYLAGTGIIAKPGVQLTADTYANRPASPAEGMLYAMTDANTATWGATITAGLSTNHVLAYYNGTNWTVAGK